MEKARSAGHSGGILAVLAFAGIVASLTQTLVVPLLGQLPQLLDTSASNATWVVTASLLAAAVTTPVSGRLGDLYGKRLVLLASTVPLLAGSVICAVSSSLWPMIIGRGLQGMSAGIVPVGIAALRDLLPRERLGSGIALISSSLGIGGALGLPLAAAVIQYSSWRVLFWGMAVLAVVVAGLILALIPATAPSGTTGRFDVLGALGLGAGLVCLLLAVSKGSGWGWGSGLTIGLFVAAVVVLLLWGWWELSTRAPLVDLRVTARPQVLLTNGASMVVGMAMYAQSLVMPQLLQLPKATGYGLGQSMMAMGLWMAPAGLMMMLVSPVGARLSARSGPKITLITGCVIIAAGYGSSMALMGSTWGLLVVSLIINTGVGFAYGAMPALVMAAVPQSETAAANSFNTLMRSIGTSVAAAVVGAVLAQMTISLGGHAIAGENGFRVSLLIGCGVAVIGAVVAAFIPAMRPAAATSDAAAADSGAIPSAVVSGAVPMAAGSGPIPIATNFVRVPGATGSGTASAAAGSSTIPAAMDSGEIAGTAAYGRVSTTTGSSTAAAASEYGTGSANTEFAAASEPPRQPLTTGPIAFGRVRDTRGTALPNAVLTLISTAGRQIDRTVSAADGYFELTATEPGSYVLIASTDGRRPDASTVSLGSMPVPCEVALTAMAGLTGTVTRDDDGAPVPDARVSALDIRGEVLASTATGADGEFGLPELPGGDVTVAVSAAGYHPSALSVHAADSDTTWLDIVLHPSARVRGVVRATDGSPLPDARVTLTDWVGNVIDSLITGPDGAYTFADLDEGTYTLVASGYAPVHNAVVVRDRGRDLDIELGHGLPADDAEHQPVAAHHAAEHRDTHG